MNYREISRKYNEIMKETDYLYYELSRESGLPDCAFWLMYSLWEGDAHLTQKSICKLWNLNKQTVNSAMKTLLEKGFITLENSLEDKRSKVIRLTEKGKEYSEKQIEPIFELEDKTFSLLGVKDCAALLELSQKYLEIFTVGKDKLYEQNRLRDIIS